MKTVLVLDALTQTVFINRPFTSGVIRAALNDANGLSEAYNVIYAYFGKEENNLPYQTYSLGPIGLKERCTNMSSSGMLMNKEKDQVITKLKYLNFDMMVVHLHSYSSYIIDICKVFNNIPKIFVIHDFILDKFTSANMMSYIIKIKTYSNTVVIGNSGFTQYLGNHIFNTRHKDILKLHPEFTPLDINSTDKFIDRGFTHFVYTKQTEPLGFENKSYSVNIGRYDVDKGVNRLLNIHNTNDHKILLCGTKDPYHDEEFKLYNRLKELEKTYDNYKLCEGYSDIDLKETIKYANNIVISCDHEGFGYTAFEAGLLGIPSIVTYRHLFNGRHATSEYLKRVGVPFKELERKDKKELYALMKDFKLSINEKKDLSKKLIEYFTIEAFVKDRENGWFESSQRKNQFKVKALF